MTERYKVGLLQDGIYEVLTTEYVGLDGTRRWMESVFQGSLTDCEAYIRLKQNEDIDF